MAWGKVDDKLYSSPKWMQATKGGKALWASALSWCMAQLTDGAVPKQVVFMLGASTQDARSLVRAGLWSETQDGYQFHDWLDYQPSREQVLSEREGARQRQQRARDKATESRKDHGVSHGVTNGEVHPSVTGDVTVPPARPDPSTSNEVPKSSRAKPKVPLPDDWEPTDTHRAKARELSLDLEWEAQKFKTFHQSKDNRYADWSKAFHTWLNRASEYAAEKSQPRQSAAEREMQVAAERHQRIESGQLGQSVSWDDVFTANQLERPQ